MLTIPSWSLFPIRSLVICPTWDSTSRRAGVVHDHGLSSVDQYSSVLFGLLRVWIIFRSSCFAGEIRGWSPQPYWSESSSCGDSCWLLRFSESNTINRSAWTKAFSAMSIDNNGLMIFDCTDIYGHSRLPLSSPWQCSPKPYWKWTHDIVAPCRDVLLTPTFWYIAFALTARGCNEFTIVRVKPRSGMMN
jgi:hypothetical protein